MSVPKPNNQKIIKIVVFVVFVLIAFGYVIGRDLAKNDATSTHQP